MRVTKEEATKLISAKVDQAIALIREAEVLADHHSLDFSVQVAYGMGGWYTGKPDDWNSSDEYDNSEHGWASSSQSC